MKKIFKLIFASFLSLMVIFSLASCADEELSEEKIKESFNEEISKFSLSKASLNNYANSAMKEVANIDVDSIINSVEVPTAKITQALIDGDEVYSNEVYMWQNAKKIYYGYYNDDTDFASYYLDLDYINQLFTSVKPTEENIDYVDLLLQLIAKATEIEIPEINIDDYLGLIKFEADDFKFENGYFVFDKVSLTNFVLRLIPITMEKYKASVLLLINSVIDEFKISIKYDGKHFNEFNFNLKINLKSLISIMTNSGQEINIIGDDSNILFSLSTALDYKDNKLSGLHINSDLDAKVINTEDDTLSYKAKLTYTFDATEAEIKNNIAGEFVGGSYSILDSYDPVKDEYTEITYKNIYSYKINSASTIDLKNRTLTSESNVSVLQTEAVNDGEPETTYNLNVKLSMNKTANKFELKVLLNEDLFIDEVVNYKDNKASDGKFTIYYGLIEKINGGNPSYQRLEMIFETKDVVVPEVLLNDENAVNILDNLEIPA